MLNRERWGLTKPINRKKELGLPVVFMAQKYRNPCLISGLEFLGSLNEDFLSFSQGQK